MDNIVIILLVVIIAITGISGIVISQAHLLINSMSEDLADLDEHYESLEKAMDVLIQLNVQIQNERLDELVFCQEELALCK